MSGFVKADLTKVESFVEGSKKAIKEFSDIRDEFDRINNTLLSEWEGEGKVKFAQVAYHITEKVGDIQGTINEINDNVVNDLINQYNDIDKNLADYNNNAGKKEGEQ